MATVCCDPDLETNNGRGRNVSLSALLSSMRDPQGNIENNDIPEGVGLDVHSTVVIWCVRSGAAFGKAEVSTVS